RQAVLPVDVQIRVVDDRGRLAAAVDLGERIDTDADNIDPRDHHPPGPEQHPPTTAPAGLTATAGARCSGGPTIPNTRTISRHRNAASPRYPYHASESCAMTHTKNPISSTSSSASLTTPRHRNRAM